jgi:hypothetical protein
MHQHNQLNLTWAFEKEYAHITCTLRAYSVNNLPVGIDGDGNGFPICKLKIPNGKKNSGKSYKAGVRLYVGIFQEFFYFLFKLYKEITLS